MRLEGCVSIGIESLGRGSEASRRTRLRQPFADSTCLLHRRSWLPYRSRERWERNTGISREHTWVTRGPRRAFHHSTERRERRRTPC